METIEYDEESKKFVLQIFMNVLSNWESIKENQQIMDCIDMKKNKLCIFFKLINPDLNDTHIQAQAITIMLLVLSITMKYINDLLKINFLIEDIE